MDKTSKEKTTTFKELTKAQICRAIVKKRECNTKAQQIVESLLEKCIDQEYLLKCLPDINQNHFEDVIEERSIMHLCGYPLCQNTISDVPKQKYRISTITNKVYDITVRKSFCSNICYKSAIYIKKQMLISPLWFREYEEIPEFNILTVDTEGLLGQEIDLSLTDKITNNELTELQNHLEENVSFQKPTQDQTSSNNSHHESNGEDIQTDLQIGKAMESVKVKPIINSNKTDQLKKPKPNPLNIVGEIIERPEKKIDPILTISQTTEKEEKRKSPDTKKLCLKSQSSVTTITIEVEKCLAEWFTLDTFLFLFGEEKVKELVKDKGPIIKEYLNNKEQSIFYNSKSCDLYQALCQKLNILELEDKKCDAQTLEKEMSLLPDNKHLMEESITELEISIDYIETLIAASAKNIIRLPLVDKNSPNSLRTSIVSQHINKILPHILNCQKIFKICIHEDIQSLIDTFEFKSNNIMFKSVQWALISVIFLKLICLRDKELENLLKDEPDFQETLKMLLSDDADAYLDGVVLWLTNVDRLLDVSDKHVTKEISTN